MRQERSQLHGLFCVNWGNAPLLAVAAAMGLCFVLSAQGVGARTMAGSPHDFSKASWNITQDSCLPCHQGQQSNSPQSTSTATYVPYCSPSFNAGPHSPAGPSLVCLSCHDGTLAINQFIQPASGTEEAEYIAKAFQVGPALHTMHPISFAYNGLLARKDGALEDPTSYHIGELKRALSVQTPPVPSVWSGSSLLGKTIDEALLVGHRVECTSCHDVHKLDGTSSTSRYFLRISGNDSSGRTDLLCRTCHVK